jgi:hypothetical protein
MMSRSAQSRGIAGSASIASSLSFTTSFIRLLLLGLVSGSCEQNGYVGAEDADTRTASGSAEGHSDVISTGALLGTPIIR